jgi:hypothetical protein
VSNGVFLHASADFGDTEIHSHTKYILYIAILVSTCMGTQAEKNETRIRESADSRVFPRIYPQVPMSYPYSCYALWQLCQWNFSSHLLDNASERALE